MGWSKWFYCISYLTNPLYKVQSDNKPKSTFDPSKIHVINRIALTKIYCNKVKPGLNIFCVLFFSFVLHQTNWQPKKSDQCKLHLFLWQSMILIYKWGDSTTLVYNYNNTFQSTEHILKYYITYNDICGLISQ